MTDGLRIVVTGASGNIGTSVVTALSADPAVESILGLARRRPDWSADKVELAAADLARTDEGLLDELLAGAHIVIHLAWQLQPTHDPLSTWRSNVVGTRRLFNAMSRVEVPALVYSSSVAAYSPGPKEATGVPESWPTDGWPTAAYALQKAYLERALDAFEYANPSVRVARVRPAFAFKRESASEQHRLFAGPLVPRGLARSSLIPLVPDLPGMRVQAVHTDDLAEAFRLAATMPVRGAFNVASDPVLDANALAELLHARTATIPAAVIRTALSAGWRLHAVPAEPALFDALLRLPIMDTSRARQELGWSPQHNSMQTVAEFLEGLREHAGAPTPPLSPDGHPRARVSRWLRTPRRPAVGDRRYAGVS